MNTGKVTLYVRLVLLLLVVAVICLVIVMNCDHDVTIWFFGTYNNLPIVWVLLATAAASILSYIILGYLIRTWHQVRMNRKKP